jgi:hypothetical protein
MTFFRKSRETTLAWMVLGLLVCIGCGDGKAPTFDVSGRVLVKGKPAQGAFLVFHPKEAAEKDAPRPYATTNADGEFKLTTYESEDGAPAGGYRVTIVWRPVPKSTIEAEKPDRLQGRYSNPATSGIEVTIPKETIKLEPFTLNAP